MRETPRDDGLWIRRFHPADNASNRVLCFPHAGGSASYFFPVARALSPKTEVLAVQYPGRQDRRHEPGLDSIDALADAVRAELSPWLDRPIALFGHSMGATLAFEVARRLEQDGTVPLALVVSGRRAPSRHRRETVHLRDDEGLIAELKALSGTDAQVFGDDELLRMVLPAIRVDYKAAETYRFREGPALAAPIHALTGAEDPKAPLEDVRAWRSHTNSVFTLRTFPGGHFYLKAHAPSVIKLLGSVAAGTAFAD
ncbi:thioesterase II family protein [Amycolatopsis australiensis]|uniref:Surfactin synthase thioesterase subunit n=1 Tax=Amycolatopsis australiensis TaxID=546364 RepID=A0A1K1SXK2_9PSEU|nr:alpha/beta fold hydrolase [Amycolatopsis australiensis]SFW88589.1 Surfactin synthase thioesterase subunit [Amycolatopsis australiensis]